MNTFEKLPVSPQENSNGNNPPSTGFDADFYTKLFMNTPAPTTDQLKERAERARTMEAGLDEFNRAIGRDPEVTKKDAQESRATKESAVKKLLEEIRGMAS